jgi:hypothetical protein
MKSVMKTGKNIFVTISALILIILTFPSGLVLAADSTEPLARPVIPKIRGMGGAYTAVAAGESTVFYNPAGTLTHTSTTRHWFRAWEALFFSREWVITSGSLFTIT